MGAVEWSSAGLLLYGHSEWHAAPVTMLLMTAGEVGVAEAIAEKREATDRSPLHTAMRGLAEELLGLPELSNAACRAADEFNAMLVAHGDTDSITSTQGGHFSFAVPADILFPGGIDDAYERFVPNRECNGRLYVDLHTITGARAERCVTDVQGKVWRLRAGR
jgi:hypothetical protein